MHHHHHQLTIPRSATTGKENNMTVLDNCRNEENHDDTTEYVIEITNTLIAKLLRQLYTDNKCVLPQIEDFKYELSKIYNNRHITYNAHVLETKMRNAIEYIQKSRYTASNIWKLDNDVWNKYRIHKLQKF